MTSYSPDIKLIYSFNFT